MPPSTRRTVAYTSKIRQLLLIQMRGRSTSMLLQRANAPIELNQEDKYQQQQECNTQQGRWQQARVRPPPPAGMTFQHKYYKPSWRPSLLCRRVSSKVLQQLFLACCLSGSSPHPVSKQQAEIRKKCCTFRLKDVQFAFAVIMLHYFQNF